MSIIRFGSAVALSLFLAACGQSREPAPENRSAVGSGSEVSNAGDTYSAQGEVTAIAGDQVTISHGPVEGLGWPAMAMTFRAEPPDLARSVKVGDQVSFAFKAEGGGYTLTSLSKSG